MKKIPFFLHIVLILLLFSCESSRKKDLLDSFQQMNVVGVNLPEPKFDKELEDLLSEYKKKYRAKGVRIGRPFMYSSDGDSTYWIKVELLNPELDNKTFRQFGKEVAQSIFNHLTNDEDFERLEVSVIERKGFIINFSSSQNTYYYRDSLQVTSK